MLNTFKTIIKDNVENFQRTLELAKVAQKKNFKTSDLGWLWAVVKPLLYMIIFYTAIALGIKSSRNIAGLEYPYFIWFITGLIPWFYIQGIIVGGANCFRRFSFLIKRFDYPIATIPTIIAFSNVAIHTIILGIGLVISIIYRVPPSIYWLQLPIYMVLMMLTAYVWSLGAGLLASMSGDVMDMLRAISPAFFWLSGIIFNSRNKESFEIIFKLNPITFIVEGYRNSICFHTWIWEDPKSLAGFFATFSVMTVIAILLYKRLHYRMADYM